jgi:hypothetical protein
MGLRGRKKVGTPAAYLVMGLFMLQIGKEGSILFHQVFFSEFPLSFLFVSLFVLTKKNVRQ